MPGQDDSPPIADFIAELDDNAVATIIDTWKKEGRRLTRAAGEAEFLLEKRMRDRGATVLDTEDWDGKLESKGFDYTVDDPGLLRTQLQDHVTDKQLAGVVERVTPEPTWVVNHRGLNELAKRGGDIARIIDEGRRKTPKPAKLSLDRKEKDEAPAEDVPTGTQ